MMKLLYTITAYPPFLGGAQLQFHEFARRLSQNSQHQLGVAYQWDSPRTDWLLGTTLNAPYADEPHQQDGVNVCRIGLTDEQRAELRHWVYLYPLLQGQSIKKIASELSRHVETAADTLLGSSPDIIHNSRIGREFITAASLAYARKLDIPFVLTPNHHHHWRGWFYRHYINIYQQADAVVVYTKFERDELIKLGVHPDRIHVLGVGAILANDADGDRFREKYNIPPKVPFVLYLGQKFAYKHFDWLLETMPRVWQEFPDTYVVFIGSETEYSRKYFHRMRKITNDDRTTVIPTVSLQEKTDALAACHILCVPSEKESFGTVYLEAWQMKKPVIGGTAPASQMIIKESNGGLYGCKSIDDLFSQLMQLLINSELRQKMGTNGLQFSHQYSWKILSESLNNLYKKLC